MGTPASSSGAVGGGGRSASGATTPIRSASSAFPSSTGRIASSSATSSRAQPPPHHHSTSPPQPSRGTPRGAFSLPVGVGVESSHREPLSRPSHSNNGSFVIGHESTAASPNQVRRVTSPTQVGAPPSSSSSHHYHHTNNLGTSSSNLAASSTAGEFRLSRRPSDIKQHDGGADVSARHGGSHSLLESAMMGAVAASPSPIRVVDDRPNDSSRWAGDAQLSPSTARIMERLSMAPPR